MIVTVLGTALNDSGIAIAGVMLGVMTPVLVVVTMRGDRARPRWAISPTAERRRPDPPTPRMPPPTGTRARMIVILGLLVGLLTVRLLVIGGRDAARRARAATPELPRPPAADGGRAARRDRGARDRGRARRRSARSVSATSPAATSHVRSCCSRASASGCSASSTTCSAPTATAAFAATCARCSQGRVTTGVDQDLRRRRGRARARRERLVRVGPAPARRRGAHRARRQPREPARPGAGPRRSRSGSSRGCRSRSSRAATRWASRSRR